MSYVKIGVGGPVGSGKTALIERLTREMSKEYSICVVTNDIYTKEDAEFLTKNSCLPADRIVGVETGGCPHTAIREDCSMNLEAVDEMVIRLCWTMLTLEYGMWMHMIIRNYIFIKRLILKDRSFGRRGCRTICSFRSERS